jgi:PKD repeat protein
MKTTITKKLLGLALSVFSIAAMAQCPTVTNMSVTLGANGTATVTPVLSGTINPVQTTYYWSVTPSATQTSNQFQSNATFQFPSNGTYTLLVSITDSLSGCWLSGNTTVTISNMAATSCNASFYFYTDSSCVTHFMNTSTGNNLTYNWYIDGANYTSANPSVALSDGSYNAVLYTSSTGSFCDSTSQYISVSCGGGGTNTPCQASFYSYTDSSCITHFVNTSLGGGNSVWYINGMTYSTSPSPAVALANGSYYATLYSYTPAGGFCDSITQMIAVSCGSGTTTPACQANSQFYIFADSLNAGNYFAYNLSWTTGTASYLWDFGDGTTSSQQYPFHQYAIPGQYIVCLTVTSTSGTLTCTDTYCDSSSVHRMAAGFQMSQVNVIPQNVTGIKQTQKEIGLVAFPNPIADELMIEATTTNDSKLTFVLVDALGRIISTGNLNNSKTTINTSNLEKGFYSLSVTSENGSSLKTIKLVK